MTQTQHDIRRHMHLVAADRRALAALPATLAELQGALPDLHVIRVGQCTTKFVRRGWATLDRETRKYSITDEGARVLACGRYPL